MFSPRHTYADSRSYANSILNLITKIHFFCEGYLALADAIKPEYWVCCVWRCKILSHKAIVTPTTVQIALSGAMLIGGADQRGLKP